MSERVTVVDLNIYVQVTALKEYLALGSSALFWKVDELTEEVVDMSWKESENYIDCGLFVMRHMETYKGTLKKWNPGFKKKAKLNVSTQILALNNFFSFFFPSIAIKYLFDLVYL